jgi:hypothetical protein
MPHSLAEGLMRRGILSGGRGRATLAAAVLSVLLAGTATPAYADDPNPQNASSPAPSRSIQPARRHRALWTTIGIGGGFVVGMLMGMNRFDDATNSSQKVWWSAIGGAAAGGTAAYLLTDRTGSTGITAPKAPGGDPQGFLRDPRVSQLIKRLRESGK